MSTRSKPSLSARFAGTLMAGIAALGLSYNLANAEEMTGNLWTHITSIDGVVLAGDGGPTKQLFQRYGVSQDDDGNHTAFYRDVISTTANAEELTWETHGTFVFPKDADDEGAEEDAVFLHTLGRVDLVTGEWTWDLIEVTGGTGKFANVSADPIEDRINEYGGIGGCFNPPNDPEGFPNVVVCQTVMNWTY